MRGASLAGPGRQDRDRGGPGIPARDRGRRGVVFKRRNQRTWPRALREAAARAEAWYLEQAKADDVESVRVFEAAGVEIAAMTEEDFNAWVALARESSFKAFVDEVPNGQALLDLALSVE